MIKTKRENIERLANIVKNNHPYDCPELITVPIEGGLPGYLEFVRSKG